MYQTQLCDKKFLPQYCFSYRHNHARECVEPEIVGRKQTISHLFEHIETFQKQPHFFASSLKSNGL